MAFTEGKSFTRKAERASWSHLLRGSTSTLKGKKNKTQLLLFFLYIFWWHLKIREVACYSIRGSYFLRFQQIGPWSSKSRLNAVNGSLLLPFPLVHLQAAVNTYIGQDFPKAERPFFRSKTQNRKKRTERNRHGGELLQRLWSRQVALVPGITESLDISMVKASTCHSLHTDFPSPLHVASCAV